MKSPYEMWKSLSRRFGSATAHGHTIPRIQFIPKDPKRPDGETVQVIVHTSVSCEEYGEWVQALLAESTTLRKQAEMAEGWKRLLDNATPLLVEIIPALNELLDESLLGDPAVTAGRDAMVLVYPSVTITVSPVSEQIYISGSDGAGQPIPFKVKDANMDVVVQLVLLGVKEQVERRRGGKDPVTGRRKLGKDNTPATT